MTLWATAAATPLRRGGRARQPRCCTWLFLIAMDLVASESVGTRPEDYDETYSRLKRPVWSTVPHGLPAAIDCPLRELSLDFASHLLDQGVGTAKLPLLFDALQLARLCNGTRPGAVAATRGASPSPETPAAAKRERLRVVVDAVHGSDTLGDGSFAQPYASVPFGLARLRVKRRLHPGAGGRLILRAGTYYLSETLTLDAADSGLTIAAHGSEAAVVSGGRPLRHLRFRPWKAGVLVAEGVAGNFSGLTWLQEGVLDEESVRLVRARHPNVDDIESTLWPQACIHMHMHTHVHMHIYMTSRARSGRRHAYICICIHTYICIYA